MEDTTQQPVKTENKGTGGGTTRFIIAGILLVGALVAGYFFFMKDSAQAPEDPTATSTVDIVLGEDRGTGPVARVNGTEISQEEYEESVGNIAETARAQGADLTDESVKTEIKTQALEALINTELLVQAAASAGIAASDEAVQTEYDGIVAQFGGQEALQAQLISYNISEETLREDIAEQLTIQAYLDTTVDTSTITVTDEEIQEFYDSLSGTQQLPELASIRDQIEAELQSQKEQALVVDLLTQLRADAQVETLV